MKLSLIISREAGTPVSGNACAVFNVEKNYGSLMWFARFFSELREFSLALR
jgi:hypothetical protein